MKQDNRRLLGGAAFAVALAAAGGFGLAKFTSSPTAAPAGAAKPAEERTAGQTLDMTPEAIKAAGVLVQPVSIGALGTEILSQGTVVAAPGGEAVLTARAPGTITRLFKRLGDSVRRGEPLAIVESRDAAQIAADHATAGAKAMLAQRNLAREKSLYDQRDSRVVY
ncbi:MAG: hypothetical protein P4L64_17955 [Caulobacteraceae bacterium]|nr:hypothetical protein [Caulobacteraceae bacterium]